MCEKGLHALYAGARVLSHHLQATVSHLQGEHATQPVCPHQYRQHKGAREYAHLRSLSAMGGLSLLSLDMVPQPAGCPDPA